MIGIIGAMQIEIDNLKNLMSNKQITNISSIEYVSGNLFDIPCVLAVCGIGKVAAAICTQTMILNFNPDKIINIGVAGSASEEVNLLDIVISDCVVEHDMDTSPLGDPKGFLSGPNIINIPADKNMTQLAVNSLNSLNINFHVGTIASGDQFISDVDKTRQIHSEFKALAVEMEGAAIGHVCYLNRTPFLIIRAISDNANSEASMSYEQFLPIAKDKTHELLKSILPII